MRSSLKVLAICLLLAAPVHAEINGNDLPSTSTWYFHVDLNQMRNSDAANGIWLWLGDEVFGDIEEETGIDLGKEADQITAYSTDEGGVVMVLEGDISQETKDKVLAISASAEEFEQFSSRGKTFYFVNDDDDDDDKRNNIEVDGFDAGAYLSFDIRDKLIVTSRRPQIEALLANNGKITGQRGHNGALFVLTAEKSLVQAGVDAEVMADKDDGDNGFDSNLLRNTKKVAFMLADVAGQIAVEAQLIAKEPKMAESLASIVRGLIALQAFSDEADSNVAEALRSTKVDVADNTLKISVTLSPDVVRSALDDA